MIPLYKLTKQYLELFSLWENEEIDEQAFHDTVEGITEDFKQKAKNIAGLVISLKREADAFRDETDRLLNLRKNRLRLAEKLESYLLRNMQATGIEKLKYDGFPSVSLYMGRGRVEIVDPVLLPKEFFRIIEEPNKSLIQDAFKLGQDVPGAKLVKEQTLKIG